MTKYDCEIILPTLYMTVSATDEEDAVEKARLYVAENLKGLIGADEYGCCISILKKEVEDD